MICVRATFDSELVTDFSLICSDFERFTFKCGENIFSVAYRPASGNFNNFLCHFDKFLDFTNITQYKRFVGGNFNINMLTASNA